MTSATSSNSRAVTQASTQASNTTLGTILNQLTIMEELRAFIVTFTCQDTDLPLFGQEEHDEAYLNNLVEINGKSTNNFNDL